MFTVAHRKYCFVHLNLSYYNKSQLLFIISTKNSPKAATRWLPLLFPCDIFSGLRKSLKWNFALIEYHVAWLRNGTVRLTNCLQTQPRWMTERRIILGSLPLSRVFLPGTHDSASYAIHERANSENIVERYVITQVNSELIIQRIFV